MTVDDCASNYRKVDKLQTLRLSRNIGNFNDRYVSKLYETGHRKWSKEQRTEQSIKFDERFTTTNDTATKDHKIFKLHKVV